MNSRFLIVAAFIGLLGVACNPVNFSKNPGPKCQGFADDCITKDGFDYFDYVLTTDVPNTKTDILIVDDNSGSMTAEQVHMADRFPTFLSSLDRLDWRIGIVTTDMNGTGALKDGNLVEFYNSAGTFFITKNTPNVTNLFQNTVKIGETGWGDERGIYAALTALQKEKSSATKGFIRDEANLAVVILSDEDERSDGGHMPAPYGGPLEAGKDNPQDLIDYVNLTWGLRKNMTVHSIIIKPGDTTCYNTQKTQSGATANYGTTYSDLTGRTGGVHGTVCADDYGSQLADIGNVIEITTGSITLACIPTAGSLQVMTESGVPMTGYTHDANSDKVVFNPPLAGGTRVRLKYKCPTRS